MTAVFVEEDQVVNEIYALRTGIGRKIMEGDEQACRNRAKEIQATAGMKPMLKLVKIVTMEQELETL
ncbi:hypothetical protein [Burkholderia phage vB_BpP_HN04]|nr:hypothetical protein [Burkholderia phage vB_BpP_HN01]